MLLTQARLGSPDYETCISQFKTTLEQAGAEVGILRLNGTLDFESVKHQLLSSDIIYVEGGNTLTLLSVLRGWGIDEILRQAYHQGVILAGVSAGAVCWFEHGMSSYRKDKPTNDGLGFLPGSCCPHFNRSESSKLYIDLISQGDIKPGLGIVDDTAVHFIDEVPVRALVWNCKVKPKVGVYEVTGSGCHGTSIPVDKLKG